MFNSFASRVANSFLADLWRDDCGAILSAETVLVGTVAVVGTGVGLQTVATSVNEELVEVGHAIRSLDQSFSLPGHAVCDATTAGSEYIQPPVEESLEELGELEPHPALADDDERDDDKDRDRDDRKKDKSKKNKK